MWLVTGGDEGKQGLFTSTDPFRSVDFQFSFNETIKDFPSETNKHRREAWLDDASGKAGIDPATESFIWPTEFYTFKLS